MANKTNVTMLFDMTVGDLLKGLTELIAKNPALITSPICIGGRDDASLHEAHKLYTFFEDDVTHVVIDDLTNE